MVPNLTLIIEVALNVHGRSSYLCHFLLTHATVQRCISRMGGTRSTRSPLRTSSISLADLRSFRRMFCHRPWPKARPFRLSPVRLFALRIHLMLTW